LDEKYLELLADYAARQIAAQRAKRENAPKIERAERAAQARRERRVGTLVKGARRSFAVSEAHKHALLLALGGRSALEIDAASEN
jgi:hypothetical protein